VRTLRNGDFRRLGNIAFRLNYDRMRGVVACPHKRGESVFVALSAEPFLSACPQWLSVITAHQDVTHFTDMTCSLVSQ
jgi:hypothetical protein